MEQFDKQVKEDQIEEINHYYEKERITIKMVNKEFFISLRIYDQL